MDNAPPLKRSPSVSRQLSVMAGRGRFLKLPIILVSLTIGILCGHLLFRFSGSWSDSRSRLRRRGSSQSDSYSSFHVPPSEREGLSIKKDMSIQFRDYQPKNYFINVGGTYPKSIDIFLQTYPESEFFLIVSFIPDVSFAPFYRVFDNHTLISPAWVSATTESVEKITLHPFGEKETMVTLPVVDIAAWLQNNTHPDDFVIVKMDIPDDEEEALMFKLVHTEAVEWIDKYYTTFPEKQHHKLQQISELYGLQIFGWDEKNESFSDFNDVNPLKVPPGAGFMKEDCKSTNSSEIFALFLYVRDISLKSLHALKMLRGFEIEKKEKPNAGLFLPYDLFLSNRELAEHLFTVFNGGLFWDVQCNRNMSDSQFRNSVVKVSNIFSKFQKPMILQNLMFSEKNEELAKFIILTRHQTVFHKSHDIASMMSFPVLESSKFIPDSGIIYSLDIGSDNNDKLALYLLKNYEEQLISLIKCAVP
ncbi:uncharacterized protein LOC133186919 [Saccostrea echinata]|uniref:uncharacterized protein LOC133186919 n=1 Tax=Saccostrea echinata TaxID=191078 RepID=UPI002A8339FE|nr:uncharacterized protein LOC133186919 [Saccostrea echinata]